MSAGQFCEEVLSRALRAKRVVVGADFRFGRGPGRRRQPSRSRRRTPGVRGLGGRHVRSICDGVVSSTRIRQLIGDGQVEDAAALLGRPYELDGRVVEGDKRGRTIGFPTANIAVSLPIGSYRAEVYMRDGDDGDDAFRLPSTSGPVPPSMASEPRSRPTCSTIRATSMGVSWPSSSGSAAGRECDSTGWRPWSGRSASMWRGSGRC